MQLAQIVPSISNVEYYAGIVRDKYDIRTLIVTAREILEDASDGAAMQKPYWILQSSEYLIFAAVKICRGFSVLMRLSCRPWTVWIC